jgi:TonB family protein
MCFGTLFIVYTILLTKKTIKMKTINYVKIAGLSLLFLTLFSTTQGSFFKKDKVNENSSVIKEDIALSAELSNKSADLGFWIDSVVITNKKSEFVKFEITPKLNIKSASEYIEENLTYPEKVLIQMIKGVVIVEFDINKEGAVTDAKILSDIEANSLVEKIVHRMKFTPAMQNGYPVSCTIRIPIEFTIYN